MVEEHNEGKEYASLESLDKDSLNDLKSLEKKLTFKEFLTGKIISVKDVETYENFMLLNVNLNKNDYPHILKWKNEIERMKLNWKISKKPFSQKGRTFREYIEKMYEKIKQNDKIYANEIKNLTNVSKNIFFDNKKEEKEIATIHFFKKKTGNYLIKILIKWLNNNNLKYQDIASKLIIISHNYFPNKCVVEELKNEKDNNWINAVIITTINKNDYDIEDFSQDIKRNINNNIQVSILSIEDNNDNNNNNNDNNNNNNNNNDNNNNNIENKEYVEIIK